MQHAYPELKHKYNFIEKSTSCIKDIPSAVHTERNCGQNSSWTVEKKSNQWFTLKGFTVQVGA